MKKIIIALLVSSILTSCNSTNSSYITLTQAPNNNNFNLSNSSTKIKKVEQKSESPSPAKQNWTLAYDTFYSGIPEITSYKASTYFKDVRVRAGLVYSIYSIDKLTTLSDINKNKKYPKPSLYGAVVENLDGSYYGEGYCDVSFDDKNYTLTDVSPIKVGDYDGRISMTITENVENQLLKAGFTPKDTKAYCLLTPQYSNGVVFQNEKESIILIQTDTVGANGTKIAAGTVISFCSYIEEYQNFLNEKTKNNPTNKHQIPNTGKPVIYLYPSKETNVKVTLDYKGDFSYTYPKYDNGWDVIAYPDGKIINKADNSEHYYLFWEGNEKIDWDFSQGFVVKGSDTEKFLQEKLKFMGLTAREYNDFITYWAPEMIKNNENIITFSTTQYEELAPLVVNPKPDSILRVHMVYKKYNGEEIPKPQELKPFERNGFTVVEWGGTRA